MGGGTSGNFGNTKGKVLDAISDLLTAASFIPGIDTFTNLAAIPVDLARGDYLSAGLDLFGVIPFVGEVADVGKYADKGIDIAKKVDKSIDVSKTTKKATGAGKAAFKMPKLPKTPSRLKSNGWKEITPSAMKKNTTSRTFKKDGITIRFDKGKRDAVGFAGKDHYHILNPNSTGKADYYLDSSGNPVPKNSKKSHIIP